jgi:hypothetical protein
MACAIAGIQRYRQLTAYPARFATYQTAITTAVMNRRNAEAGVWQALKAAAGPMQPPAVDAALRRTIPGIKLASPLPEVGTWYASCDVEYVDPATAMKLTFHFVGDPEEGPPPNGMMPWLRFNWVTYTPLTPTPVHPVQELERCEAVATYVALAATAAWLALVLCAAYREPDRKKLAAWSAMAGAAAVAAFVYGARTPHFKPTIVTASIVAITFAVLWFEDRWGPALRGVPRSHAARERDDESVKCDHCGYDLTGNLSGACPECGAPTGRISSEEVAALTRSTARLREHVT